MLSNSQVNYNKFVLKCLELWLGNNKGLIKLKVHL